MQLGSKYHKYLCEFQSGARWTKSWSQALFHFSLCSWEFLPLCNGMATANNKSEIGNCNILYEFNTPGLATVVLILRRIKKLLSSGRFEMRWKDLFLVTVWFIWQQTKEKLWQNGCKWIPEGLMLIFTNFVHTYMCCMDIWGSYVIMCEVRPYGQALAQSGLVSNNLSMDEWNSLCWPPTLTFKRKLVEVKIASSSLRFWTLLFRLAVEFVENQYFLKMHSAVPFCSPALHSIYSALLAWKLRCQSTNLNFAQTDFDLFVLFPWCSMAKLSDHFNSSKESTASAVGPGSTTKQSVWEKSASTDSCT